MRRRWNWGLVLGLGIVVAKLGVAQHAIREDYFDSDGVRIRYLVRGTGSPVVLLHGLSANIELSWAGAGILDSLAVRHQVIALDQRGHGASDKPHDPAAYGMHFVDDVVRLLDHLKIERAHVVGYSLGGVVTLSLVSRYPARVSSAVLAGVGWRSSEMGRPEAVTAFIPALDRAARGEITVLAALLGPDTLSIPPQVAALINRNDPQALAAALRGDSALLAISEQQLRSITTPMIAVVGETDGLARPDVERMASVLKTMPVTIVPGADHFTTLRHPLFLRTIMRFLDSR